MLTEQQSVALAAAIRASSDPVVVAALAIRNDVALTDWCNADSTFVVWKTKVTVEEVGNKINGTELAGLTSLNHTRLQTVVALSQNGVNPSLADRRAFFDDIFSGAGGAITRANLLALWKRLATNAERVFCTGTGTDPAPGLLVFEGRVSISEVSSALNRQ